MLQTLLFFDVVFPSLIVLKVSIAADMKKFVFSDPCGRQTAALHDLSRFFSIKVSVLSQNVSNWFFFTVFGIAL